MSDAAKRRWRKWRIVAGLVVIGLLVVGFTWLGIVASFQGWTGWTVDKFGTLGDAMAPVTAVATIAAFAAAMAGLLLQSQDQEEQAQGQADLTKRQEDLVKAEQATAEALKANVATMRDQLAALVKHQEQLTTKQEGLVAAEQATAEALKASVQALREQAEATAKFYRESNAHSLHSTRRARLDEAHTRAQRIASLRKALEYDLRFVVQWDLADYLIVGLSRYRASFLMKEAQELHPELAADPIDDELLQIEAWIREHEAAGPGEELNRTPDLANLRARWDSCERRYTAATESQKPMIKGSEDIEQARNVE